MYILPTSEVAPTDLDSIRSLLDVAFDGAFSDSDWAHTLGGTHVFLKDGDVISHGAVVERSFVVGERAFQVGYVEGVATSPLHRHEGHASRVMTEVNRLIRDRFDLGALSTGVPELYSASGWELWQGPTYVASPRGRVRTAEEEGAVMILRTVGLELDLSGPLVCDWRPGDVW